MPEIRRYTDCRAFLRDWFAEQKTQRLGFSHQFFARKAGIGSSGFLLHVMKGERNLTRPVLLKVARAMGLSLADTAFFEGLVCFDQAGTPDEREYYYTRIHGERKRVTRRAWREGGRTSGTSHIVAPVSPVRERILRVL
jgi:uncharacterized protein (TIGR02147 family)